MSDPTRLDPPDETFEELYDQAPVGYLTARPDGTITRVNGTLAGWLGLAPGALTGQRIQALLTPGARIFYETHCAPILRREGLLRQVALDLRRADGTRLPALVDWRRVDDADGGLLGHRLLVVDATDRRAYERELLAERERARAAATELARLNAELEARVEARTAELVQLQKVETLGQLTGGVAHDFNNLLTPIVGCLDILSRKAKLEPRNARLLAAAAEAAERARLLVARLLAFARRQHLNARAVDLGALVQDMSELVARSVGPMIEIRIEAASDLPPAHVDPGQLELAILNLCINARDAMEGKGRLTFVLASAVLGDGHPARLPPGPYVALAIVDDGLGMDDATLRRATEPFFTTKDPGQGTGLGLSMAKGLAQQSGGELLIESTPGQGTRVTILLPQAREPLELPSSLRVAATLPEVPPLRVLVIDDEPLVRDSVARMLRDLGHDVEEAGSGAEALDLLARAGAPDLLVTDHAMPGMTGAALVTASRRLAPDLPALLMSGYAALAGLEGEALPCLAKPFTTVELAEAIARVVKPARSASGLDIPAGTEK
ncbi:Sensor histidine kinase with PAS and Response regulator receiver domain protein [Rubellimicrobium mesophilum DSM 19309]|uniref:histidine kinase n=1 Tax=Rubellimicrobium mesophilum DSM 19309 TaxID=442562 RepID=A0A017HGW9_9RHOB|nr:PAS domain-containing hybrid sensor histidine kinase/response regulator [Rubellimicrobium mesophilum]EYD73530.1 Sensor histidine kinase with PAS and Response regulator receiver domain protein [Rubellimicrobium mesophilum DSM 19309]